MREILFKAKRIDNGEWVEGFVSRPFSKNTEGDITNYCFNALDEMGFVSECIVSADTLCQFTGLTDKNGNKIWENDVVIVNGNYTGKVIWSELWTNYTVIGSNINISINNRWNDIYEVIGNILDNPELIGE